MCAVAAIFGECAIDAGVSASANIGRTIAVDVGSLRIVHHGLIHGIVGRFADTIFIDFSVAVIVDAVTDFVACDAGDGATIIAFCDVIHGVFVCWIRVIHHEMEVLSCRTSRSTHQSDDLTAFDGIAIGDIDCFQVEIIGLDAAAVVDTYRISVGIIA